MTINPEVYRPEIDSLVRRMTARRQELGWPQSEVDAATGWAGGLTSHFERGHRRPSLAALIEWSRALGCEVELAVRRTPQRLMPEGAPMRRLRFGLNGTRLPPKMRRQPRESVVQIVVAAPAAARVQPSLRDLAASAPARRRRGRPPKSMPRAAG
jgi:transcriptional regulator with XRE-family HTH domain